MQPAGKRLHQPCHADSLYAPAFPDGDRGASSIKLVGGGNLHSAWDRLLRGNADANDVRQRVAEPGDVRADMTTEASANGDNDWFKTDAWLAESNELAKSHVYTSEIMEPVIAASRG